MIIPNINDIQKAHERIQAFIHQTPVLKSNNINKIAGCSIIFKCENLQKAGSFKIRGATNSIMNLSESEKKYGVATHSSGNFAQALALAAQANNISAKIVMPNNSPKAKVNAVKGYGGGITFCEPNLKARESTLKKIVDETGATFLHPYDSFDVVCGQGTATLELLQEYSDIDIVIAPVGGGGLISGTAIAAKESNPKIKVIAAEPKGADDAYRSFISGKIIPSENPKTIADGLLTSLGEINFPIIQKYVDDIITVSEVAIIKAMKLIWQRMKIIVEPSAAVSLAAILEKPEGFDGKKVAVILSGGNLDLDNIPWIKPEA